MRQLEGNVAIITGAGSGIGRAIALGFAVEGAGVVIADVNMDGAKAVAAEIGANAIAVKCDVSLTQDAYAMVKATVDRFGRVDILVNNAGRSRGNLGGVNTDLLVSRMSDEDWDTVFATNVRGTFLCSRAALQHMIPQKSGVIINTASGLGMRSRPGASAYGASKAAVIHFTQTLAMEVARYGIRVNAFTPGVTDTPFWRAARTEAEIEQAFKDGIVGKPDDLVPTLIFLASDAARDISGVTIPREIYVKHSSGGTNDPANR
jgi:NAD(P)-dependent dehydrogenase (short-subunit alcohol dehydrogenase family)